ncbi:MAG: hypothetical protein H8E98_00900 [Bacteroidetes bacterium]|nr:hypothetical protein [Bacteroidota bacterium]
MENTKYDERYVAFVDILGFTDLVGKSADSNSTISLADIVTALKFTPPAGQDKIVLGRIGDISKSNHQMSSFSDNIFISTDSTENGLMHIINHLEQISFKLLKLGFLCRGGLTKGLCYHHENIVFGPAVIEAHDIEKKVSKYPRVVLSDTVIQDGQNANAPINEIFNTFVRKDFDSKYFVHYLRIIRLFSDSMEKDQQQDYIEMLRNIENKIEENLNHAKNEEKDKDQKDCPIVTPVQKNEWIKEYFRFAKDRSHLELLNTPFPSRLIKDILA